MLGLLKVTSARIFLTTMPRLSTLQAALIGGLFGAIGPLMFVTADILVGSAGARLQYRWLWHLMERLAPTIWPTHILMAMTHRTAYTTFYYTVLAIAFTLNVALFATIAVLAWLVMAGMLRIAKRR